MPQVHLHNHSMAAHCKSAAQLKQNNKDFNPLSPHDALKHYFAYLKNDLISWNLVVLERKLSWNCFKNNSICFHLSPTASHFHPLQVENCDSNSRLVVDEDDNGKFRLERVKITQ